MNKKKTIAIIVIIIAVGLLVAGGILVYQNYSNKNRIVTSFNELKADLEKVIPLNNENSNAPIKQTVTGTTTFNINPLLGNSSDGSDIIINNLNSSSFNYQYRLDTEAKKMYLEGSLVQNAAETLGINFYQNENISYIFLRNIFDKYIMINDNDIFTYLEENQKAIDDINYIYDKVIESLGNNITSDDIKVSTENNEKKISLELDEKRLNEISNNIINDLKNDNRAKEILGENIDNLDTSNDSNDSDSKSYLAYNIYLNKNDIATYEFVLNDSENNYSIAYNKKENSFSIKENDKETFKGVISTKDNATTITLTSDNTNIGTITISENNISANIIFDEATNTSLTVNINSLTSENTTTTTADIAISSSGTNIDILSLTDIKTITDNVANFDNIDTTNSIDINNLTETDMTTIQNNLMIVLYSFMGITM